jgi:hypothetical protein
MTQHVVPELFSFYECLEMVPACLAGPGPDGGDAFPKHNRPDLSTFSHASGESQAFSDFEG